MANLLPQKYIQRQHRSFTWRLVILISLAVTGFSIVGLLLLAPAYIMARTQAAALEHEVAVLNDSLEVRQRQRERDDLAAARENVRLVEETLGEEYTLPDILREVIERRVGAVGIERLTYSRKHEADGSGTLLVAGSTNSPQELSSYVSNLEVYPAFERVDIPLAALASAEDGTFTITVTGSF